jgi:transposase
MTKNKHRVFTAELKAQVVLEVMSGMKSFSEACRQYHLSDQTLSRWKREFIEHAAVIFEQNSQRSQESERIAELERMIGKLTVELEIAKKASSIWHSLQSRSETSR